MYEVMKEWMNRYLSDEEPVVLAILILLTITLFLALGTILTPIFISFVFAFVMQGAVKNLVKYHMPRGAAFYLTYVVFLFATFGFFFFIVPRVWTQLENLVQELPNILLKGQALLLKLPEYYPDTVTGAQVQEWVDIINTEIAQFGQKILSASISLIPLMATISIYVLMVPILVFFLLKDRDKLLGWFQSLLP
ncbi:MAG: AI-2E family transporter, partial [Gammaproteobacteria bacterium]|nr:AI-2E family transporter [Gammaproteobacteria bacterium]